MRLRWVGWAALGAVIVLQGGCGSDGPAPAFVESDAAVPVVEARKLHLLTACAEEVDATVSETDEAVRIDDIDGDPISGADCLGGVVLRLAEPIGDRAVVVDGKTWQLQQGTDCPHGRFAPPDANRTPDCEPVP